MGKEEKKDKDADKDKDTEKDKDKEKERAKDDEQSDRESKGKMLQRKRTIPTLPDFSEETACEKFTDLSSLLQTMKDCLECLAEELEKLDIASVTCVVCGKMPPDGEEAAPSSPGPCCGCS